MSKNIRIKLYIPFAESRFSKIYILIFYCEKLKPVSCIIIWLKKPHQYLFDFSFVSYQIFSFCQIIHIVILKNFAVFLFRFVSYLLLAHKINAQKTVMRSKGHFHSWLPLWPLSLTYYLAY